MICEHQGVFKEGSNVRFSTGPSVTPETAHPTHQEEFMAADPIHTSFPAFRHNIMGAAMPVIESLRLYTTVDEPMGGINISGNTKGTRSYAANAYHLPSSGRKNLTLLTGEEAQRPCLRALQHLDRKSVV